MCSFEPVKCWSRLPNSSGGTIRRSSAIPLWVRARRPLLPRVARLGDQGMIGELGRERRRIACGGDDVDVLAGVGPAPRRARQHDLLRGIAGEQSVDELRSGLADVPEETTLLRALRLHAAQLREHVLLELRPQALQSAELSRLGGRLQLLERCDPGLVVDTTDRLRADPGNPRQVDEGGGELLLQLPGGRDLALVEQGDDLLLDRVADALHRGRLALLGQLPHRLRAVGDHPRRLLVGEHAEAVSAIELVEGSELAEGGGDLGVSHPPKLAPCRGRAQRSRAGRSPASRALI